MFQQLRFISLAMLHCLWMVAPLPAQEAKGAERIVLQGSIGVPIRAVLFTPNGKTIIAADREGVIHLLDAKTGKAKRTLKGHTDRILSLSLTADGKRLASGGGRKDGKPLPGEIRIWDLDTGKELHQLKGHTAEVNCVSFSPDGYLLASGADDQTIKLWDPRTGKEHATLKGHVGEVNAVAISPDGKRLISGGQDQSIRIWNLPAGKEQQVLKSPGGWVYGLAFTLDGRTFASVNAPRVGKQTLTLWDPVSGKERASVSDSFDTEVGGGYVAVAFRPDGKTVATAQRDWTVQLRDATTGQDWHVIQGFATAVNAVAFSPDGNTLATGHEDGSVRLWDVPATKSLPLPRWGSTMNVRALAFHPNGKTLAAFEDGDWHIKLFDLATGQVNQTFKGEQTLWSITFADEGKLLFSTAYPSVAFGSPPVVVRAWEVSSGKIHATLKTGGSGSLRSAVTADGRTVANGVSLWDVASGKPTRIVPKLAKGEVVRCVALTLDGKLLVAGTGSEKPQGKRAGVVLVGGTGKESKWQVWKGHEHNIHSVVVTADGKTAASASWDGTVRVWDVAASEVRHILKADLNPQAIAFTPDGKVLAVALSVDSQGFGSSVSPGEVRLWDVKTGKLLAHLPHYRSVYTVAVSPDGATLAAGTYGKIRMWDLKRLLRPSRP